MKPLMSKSFFIIMQLELIFTRSVFHLGLKLIVSGTQKWPIRHIVNNFVRMVLVPVLVRFEILINITFLFNLCLITRIRKFATLTLLCSNLIVCCAV